MFSRNCVLRETLLSIVILFLSNVLMAQNTTDNWPQLFYQSYYLGFKQQPPLREYWMNLSTSGNVVDLQPLSYGLDAILAMFESTDSTQYLDDAITITNNVMDSSQVTERIAGNRSRFKDTYRGWIERRPHEKDVFMQETVLSEIYFFQYVTRLLKDIHNSASLSEMDEYSNFYSQTLNFVENNIWDKWENRGTRINAKYAYLYLGLTHMESHWAYIAAELYFLTKSESRKADYLDFVNHYNGQLEKNFVRYDKFITWNSTWDYTNAGLRNTASSAVQDVSHANLVVSYIVEANSLGLWSDTDAIRRIINTVKYKLWDPSKCIFSDNIDGTFFNTLPHSSVGSFQADGFVKLTRYDKSLFTLYEKFVSCSPFLIGWNQYGQLFANLALSEKLLNG